MALSHHPREAVHPQVVGARHGLFGSADILVGMGPGCHPPGGQECPRSRTDNLGMHCAGSFAPSRRSDYIRAARNIFRQRVLTLMSIATKAGDWGSTGLMYNRRVPKHDPRVEAYGCVDELNAALGLARAAATDAALGERLRAIQQDLVPLMGELATDAADHDRYLRDGFPPITAAHTARLDDSVHELETSLGAFSGWATPGENPCAAALDWARAVCRRAERRASALQQQDQLPNGLILVYLNRLADVLWLLARAAEARQLSV